MSPRSPFSPCGRKCLFQAGQLSLLVWGGVVLTLPAWRGQGEAAGSVWSPGLAGLSLHPRESPPNQARDGQCPMRGGQRGVLGGPVDGRGISAGIRGHPPSVQLLAGGSRTGTALQEVSNGASMRHCTASFIYTRAPPPPATPPRHTHPSASSFISFYKSFVFL